MKKFSLIGGIGFLALLFTGCVTDKEQEIVLDRSEFDWELVWSDDFNNPEIDESKWNFIKGAGGYGNNELQFYSEREENARIEKGKLIIEAHKEDYKGSSYTSAKMTTQGKGDWTYGHYEIRAKLPKGQGIWPAFWMMPTDYKVYGSWPACGEIDIMEVLGHEPNKTYGTLHYGNPYKYTGGNIALETGTFNDSYHVFGIDWLPGEIRWYIDGELFHIENDWYSSSEGLGGDLTFPAPFDRDFFMQFNLAVGGNWPGNPDDTTIFPQQLIVDWIKVYESKNGYPRIKPKKAEKDQPVAAGRDPDGNGNYVLNTSFENDMAPWVFENFEGGSGASSLENGELHIAIKSPGGQTWANQLYQKEMNVKQGVTYNISFKARAEEPRQLMLKIGGLEPRGWAAYSSEIFVDLDTEMKDYNFEFTMKEKSDPKARYEFNMGLSDIDIWLDDILLTQISGDIAVSTKVEIQARKPMPSGNLIYNGTFDKGLNRTAFWNLEVDGNSDAMINVNPELYKREGNLVTLDSSGKENGIVLFQDNIDVKSDETYELVFDAYARADRKIMVAIQDSKGNNLYNPQIFELTTEKEIYSVKFPMDKDHKNIRVAFLASIGKDTQKITLDNVSFIKLKKPITISTLTKIEAENFDSKTSTPQTQECSEGTLNVGWMTDGDWLKYRLNVETSGTYKISYRLASEKTGILIKTESSVDSDIFTFNGTGEWQKWTTVIGEIDLVAGESFLTLSGVDININWFELELLK